MKRCLRAPDRAGPGRAAVPRRRWRPGIVAVVLIAVAGCQGAATVTRETIHPLEQNGRNALAVNQPAQAVQSFADALLHYEAHDDLGGQWRVRRQLLILALDRRDGGDGDRPGPDAGALENEAALLAAIAQHLDDDHVQYETLLLRGRVTGDGAMFRRAGDHARTPAERAVVAAYLGDVQDAVRLIDEAADAAPADRAFIYYRHARSLGTMAAYARALTAYRQAGDPRGIADSLTAMARIAAAGGDVAAAGHYAIRAERALRAIDDDARADRLRTWRDSL